MLFKETNYKSYPFINAGKFDIADGKFTKNKE